MILSIHLSHKFAAAFLAAACLALSIQPVQAQKVEKNWTDTLLAKTLLTDATQLHLQDDHDSSLVDARRAFLIYTDLYGENHWLSARARTHIARELRCLDLNQESIELFNRSLATYEALSDTTRMASCHHQIGLCLQNMKRFAEAVHQIQIAIDLVKTDSIRLEGWLADFRAAAGSTCIEEKNYLAAIPYLEMAKATYTRLKNPYALGLIFYHLGGAYFGLNDFVRARENYLSSMANLKGQIKVSHSYFADLNVKIALCYQKTGEPETGLALMEEAKKEYLAGGTEHTLNYVAFLQRLGQFYLAEGQYSVAIEHFQLCLAEKEARLGTQSPRLKDVLLDLGQARTQAGLLDEAASCYRRSLQLITDSLAGDLHARFPFYSKLAELELMKGHYERSAQLCDSAFTMAGFDPQYPENVYPNDYFRELCRVYARSFTGQFEQNGDTTYLLRAEHYFALAAQTLYREVEDISVHSSREIFYDRDYPVSEEWLDTRMRLFAATHNPVHAEAAFQIAGSSKAFLLADAMRRSGALRYAGVPDSVIQAELGLRERIVSGEKSLENANLQGKDALDASLALNRDLTHWREAYDDLLRHIEQTYPEYYHLRLLQANISTSELRRHYLAPGQALLLYSLAGQQLHLFVLTRDTFCARTLPVDSVLEAELITFKSNLTAYFTTADPDDGLYDRNLELYLVLAQALYNQLVLPVEALLPKRVIIIPDGKLYYLPFEALLSAAPSDAGNMKTYPFWAREKAVSYAFSTDFLLKTAKPPDRKAEKEWLGVAPFAEKTGNSAITSRGSTPASFPTLPFSGKEIDTISTLLRGDTWLGEEARPGRFESEAGRYRILHLATHSRADDRLGDYSYVATAYTGDPLPAKDFYQFSLAAEMVVLSACEAGGGKLLRGEGIIGMVRALTYAGARSTVASLWVANDQGTAALMVDFYRNLRNGMPKDLALHAAQNKLFNEKPELAHPFFWAGFRVFGNVTPLFH